MNKKEFFNICDSHFITENIFLIGRMGTGKSFLLNRLVENLKEEIRSGKVKIALLGTRINFFYRYSNDKKIVTALDEKRILNLLKEVNRRISEGNNKEKILMVIDDSYDLFDDEEISAELVRIINEGSKCGINCIVSSQSSATIPFKAINSKYKIVHLD